MPDEFPLMNTPLAIRTLQHGTGLVLTREADLTGRAALAAALAPLSAGSAGEICLDLTGLHFIDLACARELIGLAGRHPGARVIVRNPPWCLLRITALLNPYTPVEFTGTPHPGPRPGCRTPAAAPVTTVPPPRPQPPQVLSETTARDGLAAAEAARRWRRASVSQLSVACQRRLGVLPGSSLRR